MAISLKNIAGRFRLGPATLAFLGLVLAAGAAAAAPSQPDLMVKLASDGNTSYLGRGVIESIARSQTRTDGTLVGTASIYDLVVKNDGSETDSFVLKGTGSGTGFTVSYFDPGGTERSAEVTGAGFATGPLAPGASSSLQVQVTPRVDTLGAFYRATITASSASDPGAVDQVKTETVICGTSAGVMISVVPDGKGFPGNTVTYPYTVTNVGNRVNTFALAVANSDGWRVAAYSDDGASGGVAGDGVRQEGETTAMVSTGALSPGQSCRLFVTVTVPPESADLAFARTQLSATGEGAYAVDEAITSTIAATITMAESVRNLTLGGPFAASVSAFPGDTLQYRFSVTNSGSVPAVGVGIDTSFPESMKYLPETLWIGTASEGDGTPCPQSQCGLVRESSGTIMARLGEGATDVAGGTLSPGKTLYVFFRMQVD